MQLQILTPKFYLLKANRIWAIVVLLCLVWLASIWLIPNRAAEQSESAMAVQTTLVAVKSMPETFKTIAVLAAKREVLITNGVAGQVKNILVNDGLPVTANTPLVTLQPDFTVRAPIDGYLTNWQIAEGAYLPVGTVLAKLVNRKQLKVEYYVPEQYLAKLKLGNEVEVRVRSYQQKVFRGNVVFISPVVELKNHSILVRAEIDNTENELIPGLFCEITYIINPNLTALAIPESCLTAGLEGYQVYKVVDKKVAKQDVKIGQRANGVVEVLSGLQVGEEVIITHPPGLRDGGEVTTKQL